MEIRCRCGDTCIRPVSEILKDIELFYKPCRDCKPENIKKFSPLAEQINLDEVDSHFGICKCGKRHLDIVMSHVLKTMIDAGIKDKDRFKTQSTDGEHKELYWRREFPKAIVWLFKLQQ